MYTNAQINQMILKCMRGKDTPLTISSPVNTTLAVVTLLFSSFGIANIILNYTLIFDL